MKIDVLATDGSPLGVSLDSLWGRDGRIGVGGAEYAILTLCEEWTKAGHDIVFYNNALGKSNFEHRLCSSFNPKDNRDVLIIFRSPNPKAIRAKGKRVWFSTDQRTIGDFRTFSLYVDQIVCISPFHVKYFKDTYDIFNADFIDLPVRVDDFTLMPETKQPNNRLIFTSVPDRGLNQLYKVWKIIKEKQKDTSLVITSDYRLWGANNPSNQSHLSLWLGEPDVAFLGAVTRNRYLQELLQAEMLIYPSTYDELFCISVAEASCAGVFPITSGTGALPTTNLGVVLEGNPLKDSYLSSFADVVLEYLSDKSKLREKSKEIKEKTIERFRPSTILQEWDKIVFNDIG